MHELLLHKQCRYSDLNRNFVNYLFYASRASLDDIFLNYYPYLFLFYYTAGGLVCEQVNTVRQKATQRDE